MPEAPLYLWTGSAGVGDLMESSIRSAIAVGIPVDRLRVLAFDDTLAARLGAAIAGLALLPPTLLPPEFAAAPPADERYAPFGTLAFNRMSFARYLAVQALLGQGETVVYVDADVAFLRDPTAHLADPAAHDPEAILFQNDRVPASQAEADEAPARGERPARSECCTGFFRMTPHPRTLDFIDRLLRIGEAAGFSHHDQTVANFLHPLFARRIQLLRQSTFPVGAVAWGAEGQPPRRIDPYVVHANWVVGAEAKIGLLRAMGAWHLPAH